jgi:hypothetical protein
MAEVESVTLTTTLRIESPNIIINSPRFLPNDIFVKGLAREEGDIVLGIERPVEIDARYDCISYGLPHGSL